MLIQSTKDLHQGPIKMLLYGEGSMGKTHQLGLVKKAGFNPLIISAENGLLSIQNAGVEVDYVNITQDDKGVPVARGAARVARILEVFKYLQTPEAQAKYDTVCLDTITEIASSMSDQAVEEKKAAKGDLRQAWGEYAQNLMRLVYAFRDLPKYNVIFTCQEELDKDELTGQRFYGPSIPGNAAKGPLFQSLDIVYRLFKNEKNERFFQTDGTATIKAKHRGSKLQAIEPADLGAIMRRIKDGEGSGQGVPGNQDNRASTGVAQPGSKAANPSVRGGTPTSA